MPRISIGGTRELTVTTNISGQAVWVGSGQIIATSGVVDIANAPTLDATVSGSVTVISGLVSIVNAPTLNINALSGYVDIRAGGIQVSGAVQVSGVVSTSISGQPIDIVIPTTIITNATTNPLRVNSNSGGVALTSADCVSVTVKALSTNSGHIYVGGYTAGHMPYSGAGLLLEAGEAINIDIDNTGKVRVFATVSGDRVTYIANN